MWTPIPVISWLLPFVGHMGICTSKGVILDFAGPYFISVDSLAFGNPARYNLMPLVPLAEFLILMYWSNFKLCRSRAAFQSQRCLANSYSSE